MGSIFTPQPRPFVRAHHALAAEREWGHVFLNRKIHESIPILPGLQLRAHQLACSGMEMSSRRQGKEGQVADGAEEGGLGSL
jgi:hypothetical protein